ncbi:MAG: Hint domain-containing protein [Rhodobacteraceae bacterium]|nr:Hint domain-containing protein [Paracoccaceae bacterium]
MPLPKRSGQMPGLTCHLFPAASLRATLGANVGDPLVGDLDLSPGDSYALATGARAFRAVIDPDRDAQHLAKGSEIGTPGDPVRLTGQATLMAPDGHRVEVLTLRHEPAGAAPADYVLLLSPMTAGLEHTLLSIGPAPANLRAGDIVLASFEAGTRIMLPDGTQRPIEAIAPGDRVLTRDHGAQPVRWSGAVTLRAIGGFAPVVIPAGTLGNAGDLVVSRHHRLFIYNRRLAELTGMPELLVPAGLLVDDTTVVLREGGFVTYHALVFERHEIVYAEGIPAESLMVNATTIARLPDNLAREVRDTFPDLAQDQHFGLEAGPDLLAAVGREAIVRRGR